MIRLTAILCAAAMIAAPVQARPILAAYLASDGNDAFAAIADGVAFGLDGCATVTEAQTVLQIDVSDPVLNTTQASLTQDHGLGAHPALPCNASAEVAVHWPLDTRIWADLGEPITYFLALPGEDAVYVLPSRCATIRDGVDVRSRIQGPSLQGLAPPTLPTKAVIDCGNVLADPVSDGDEGDGSESPSGWSLHRFPIILGQGSVGFSTIFVARYSDENGTAYLPIWRHDGISVADLFLGTQQVLDRRTAQIGRLFGLNGEFEVTPLVATDLPFIQQALFLDLCQLDDCSSYVHQHGVFELPGTSVDLTIDGMAQAPRGLTHFGHSTVGLAAPDGRSLRLANCAALEQAMGLAESAEPDWATEIEAALAGGAADTAVVDCSDAIPTCVRTVVEGGAVTSTLLAPGADCPGTKRLRIELQATATAPAGLEIGSGFQRIDIAPSQEHGEVSVLTVTPVLDGRPSACTFKNHLRLIGLRDGVRLQMSDIRLVPADGGAATSIDGIHAEGGEVALRRVDVSALPGGGATGTTLGVFACQADLYLENSKISSARSAVLAFGSKVAIGAKSVLTGNLYALDASGGSLVRMNDVDLIGRSAAIFTGAKGKGTKVRLQVVSSANLGHAVELRSGGSADFRFSSARGFRCVGSYLDALSELSFILPANSLADDNIAVSCPPGRTVIVE